jgi:tetratricopeptide (TPR) repeat protein
LNFLILTLLIFISFNAYCEDISITSNPEQAIISVKNAQTGQEVKIGKTPYKGSLDAIVNNIASGSVFMLEIAKDGFEPYRILITKTGTSDIAINVNMTVSRNMKMTQDFDLLMSELFDVQRMIRTKDYSSSLEKLNDLIKKFPHFSIVYELKASVFYLMKEFKRSLTYYRKSFAVNPKNRDAYRMKIYLEKKFKIASR